MGNTAWKDIYTKSQDGHVVTVSKAFVNYKAEYTIRFGAEKKDEGGSYVSPNLPFDTLQPPILMGLFVLAGAHIDEDRAADAKAEAERVKALAAKPSAQQAATAFKPKGPPGVIAPKVPGAPRATGKTAKKKAKLAARAEAAKSKPA